MIWCIKTYIIAYVKIKKWRYTVHYVKLQPNCCLEIDLKRVELHAGGKWLNHDTKRRKDNWLQSLQLPCNSLAEYPSWVARYDLKGSDGTMLDPILWKKVQGQKHPGRWGIVEHQIPSIKVLFKTNT